jgi:hypothetical protein
VDIKMTEALTDEDRIIESLSREGATAIKHYEDPDFQPTRQTLYNVPTVTPEYDDEIFPQIVYVNQHLTHFDTPLCR